MTYMGDVAAVLCIWGWALACACGLVGLGVVRAYAVGQLIALSLIAAAGWTLCLVGYAPQTTDAQPFEMIGMHPLLGPLVWLGGPMGMAALWHRRRFFSGLGFQGKSDAPWSLCILGCALCTAWVWSLGPPLRVDEGIYHLSLPVQYARAGGYVPIAGHGNAGFFALGDMLFWWCVMAGAPGAARQMQGLVMIVGWAALWVQAPKLLRHRVLWAWALWLIAPIVLWDVSCAYVDVMEAVFSLVGISCLADWYASSKPRDDVHLAQAAWLLGAAAACRQLALGALPALGLVVLWRLRREADAVGPAHGKRVFGAWALCLVLPLSFMAHNVWVFGNPLFPFAADLFAHSAQLAPSQMQVLDAFLSQHGPMSHGLPRTGLDALWHLPYALLFDASFASPKFDGVIGPLPLIAAFVWALQAMRNKKRAPTAPLGQQLMLGFAALRTIIWLSTSWQARFVIMPLGALSLWVCQAWPSGAHAYGKRRWFDVCCKAVCASVALGALTSLWGHAPHLDWRYLGPAQARMAARIEQAPASRLCALAAQHTRQARVMLVWTQRLAVFCPTDIISDSYDEAATWVSWLEADAAPSLFARLQNAHITHVLIDVAALLQLPEDASPLERNRWARIQARWQKAESQALQLVDAAGSVKLYAVGPP